MDHLVFRFKEEGIGVNEDDALKIAEALKNANYKGSVLLYVEFEDADALYNFFKLLRLARLFGDPEKLEESLNKTKKEKDELENILRKEANINVEVNVEGTGLPIKLYQLESTGIVLNNHEIKMEILDDKIKLSVKHMGTQSNTTQSNTTLNTTGNTPVFYSINGQT